VRPYLSSWPIKHDSKVTATSWTGAVRVLGHDAGLISQGWGGRQLGGKWFQQRVRVVTHPVHRENNIAEIKNVVINFVPYSIMPKRRSIIDYI